MSYEYIFVRLFAGLSAAAIVALFYGCAKFCAAGNSSGHRPWDQPAKLFRRVQVYGGCVAAALFMAGLIWSRPGPHQTDNGIIVFVVLAAAAALGAASGFTQSRPPRQSVTELPRSLDATTDDAFRDLVGQYFGAIAEQCNTSLSQIEPLIFGFCTDHAVLTVGAYPGHFRGICVKLRRRSKGEAVSVRDDADIGLANFEAYVRRDGESDIYTRRQRWTVGEIRKEIESLAIVTRKVAIPFLTTANADWAGVRQFVDEKIERAMRDRSRPAGT